MATATLQSAPATGRHQWGSVAKPNTQMVAVRTPAVKGSVEVILRKPRRPSDQWGMWWEGGAGGRHSYTVLLEEGGGDEVRVERQPTLGGDGCVIIEADGHCVALENFPAGDVREFAGFAGEMLGEMALAERQCLTWQLERGEVVVEFANWSRHMVEQLRDQAERLADSEGVF